MLIPLGLNTPLKLGSFIHNKYLSYICYYSQEWFTQHTSHTNSIKSVRPGNTIFT